MSHVMFDIDGTLVARVGRVATRRMEWQNGSAGSNCLIVFVRIANLMRH